MLKELEKGVVDEWRLWCNTVEPEDILCLEQIAANHRDKGVTIQHNEDTTWGPLGSLGAIRAFYTPETMDVNTIYLRVDDDICWVHPDAVENIVKFRVENPDYLMLASNMVNSGLCSHLNMRTGAHPVHPKMSFIPWDVVGGPLWYDYEMATLIHDKLLADMHSNTFDRWMGFERWELHEYIRFGVAFCCFWGRDALKFLHEWKGVDDECFLSMDYPRTVNRLNCIVGNALVSHFGYNPQRRAGLEDSPYPVVDGREDTRPCGILNRYRAFAGVPQMEEKPEGKLNG
jgi:hypothetical protein